jgi:hypothetical protein
MTAEQEHRVSYLEAAGWERVGNSWERDASDPRWSISGGHERVTGETFEDATIAAFREQLARDAGEIHRRAQA